MQEHVLCLCSPVWRELTSYPIKITAEKITAKEYAATVCVPNISVKGITVTKYSSLQIEKMFNNMKRVTFSYVLYESLKVSMKRKLQEFIQM